MISYEELSEMLSDPEKKETLKQLYTETDLQKVRSLLPDRVAIVQLLIAANLAVGDNKTEQIEAFIKLVRQY